MLLLSSDTITFSVAVSSPFSVEELLLLVSVDEYDIVLDWHGADPKSVYYIDVESRSDFLAN